MERATVFERPQMGVETEPGTAVDADARITAFGVAPQARRTGRAVKSVGSLVATDTSVGKHWTEAAIEGHLDFNNIVYLLSSLLCTADIDTPDGATNARTWTFAPSHSDPNTIDTFTLDVGSSGGAAGFSMAVCRDLSFTINEEAIDLRGMMIGQKLDDTISMTATPTLIPDYALDPANIDIQIGTSIAGIATMGRPLALEFGIANRFNGRFVLDSTVPGYKGLAERAPAHTIRLVLEADAEGIGYMDSVDEKTLLYLRILCTGPNIETNFDHSFQLTIPVKLLPGDRGDQADVYGISYVLEPVMDFSAQDGMDSWCEVVIQNTLTELLPSAA